MTLFKLIVKKEDPKKLGSFLLKNGFSRQALIKAKNYHGLVLVNHKRRYTSYLLHDGDVIHFLTGEEKENQWLKPSYQPLEVIKETSNYLIINKPAGVLSIPSRYEDNDALVNRVMGYFEKNKVKLKPHVITRLDRNTSGLVLIGKNAIAHARFSKIDKHNFIKKYHAVVHGNFFDKQSGLINAPIGKIGTGVKRGIIKTGQNSQTKYQVLSQTDNASLVELRLLTGRTHQIRVHMAYLDHPLFGDQLYGFADGFERQALNCYYLAFKDPFSGENVEVKIDEPTDFKQLWQKIK